MANPSIKNGYAQIANEFLEHLAKTPLTAREFRIFLVVLRKTWGWHTADGKKKNYDWVAYGKLSEATGIGRRECIRVVNSLLQKRILLKKNNQLGINQDYDSWLVASEPLPPVLASGVEATTASGVEATITSGVEATHKRKERNINKIQKKVPKKSLVPDEPRPAPKPAPPQVPTPSQIAKQFFGSDNMQQQALDWLSQKGIPEQVARNELQKFILYWTEPNKSGTKQRWELEKAFEINRRLATWFSRIKSNGHKPAERTRKIWTLD